MHAIAPMSCRTILRVWIRDTFGNLPNAAKILGRLAGCSHRTAMGWLTGRYVPDTDAVLTLMANSPELVDAINREVERRRCLSSLKRVPADGELVPARCGSAGSASGASASR